MKKKIYTIPALFFIMALLQMNPALARSDDLIKSEIEAKIGSPCKSMQFIYNQ